MQQIRISTQRDLYEIVSLAGRFPETDWYDALLTEGDCFVYKPNGQPLLCVLRGVLTGKAYAAAYAALVPLARGKSGSASRGDAAGNITPAHLDTIKTQHAVIQQSRLYYRLRKQDGTMSKTASSLGVPSFVAGFIDRYDRFPYCRQTAYTNTYPERLIATLPALRSISMLFHEMLPDRYAAQHDAIHRTHTDFKIPSTVFTTLTVNRNWQTALHTDAGDLLEGFGAMACFRAGHYTGGYYVMPRYRIAVDLHAGDVLFSDVHEYHGNTALVGDAKRYERITVVCYFRAKMTECGSAHDELERAKRLRGGALVSH